jgi:hypothetical protein
VLRMREGRRLDGSYCCRISVDLIDYLEPTMVIVGSRGLGKLSG